MEQIMITPTDETLKNESYACTDCQSDIEIISMDIHKKKISFKCFHNNHDIKNMLIKDYINLMEKNTYLYDACSICNKNQKENNIIFNFCTECKTVICEKCTYRHTNNNKKSHFLIKNNQKTIMCMEHPKNKNTEFCLDCKKHLCHECLKSRKHFNHRKNNLVETNPTEEEKTIMSDFINDLGVKKLKMEKFRDEALLELKHKIIKEKNDADYQLNTFINRSKDKLKKDIAFYNKKLIYELEKAKKEYENTIKLKLNIFNTYIKELNIKFEKEIDNYKNFYYKNKIDTININYKNDYNDLLNINEIIKNSLEKYDKNYYYNINFVSIVSSIKTYYKSEKNILNNLVLNDDNDKIINEKEDDKVQKENEDEKKENKYNLFEVQKKNENLDNIENIKRIKEINKKKEQKNNKIKDKYQNEINRIKIKKDKNKRYSYECINEDQLTLSLIKGENKKINIILKNNGELTWPENKTKLIFDKESIIKGNDLILLPQKCEEKINYTINVPGLDELKEGKYYLYLWFTVKGEYLGKKITIEIIVQKNEELILYGDKIKEFRENFGLSEEDYDDERLLESLIKNNFNYDKTFEKLFN